METAAENGSLETLLKLLKLSGLDSLLKEDGPFTLLAPDDSAFAQLQPKQLESFRSLMQLLHERNQLRMVTVIVDGEPAAVDMGSLHNGMLTMLAGGTNEKFRGIAKLINMHHITYACEQKLDSVDFLCGDFNWKTLFHLTPAPLYVLDGTARTVSAETVNASRYSPLPLDSRTVGGAPHV